MKIGTQELLIVLAIVVIVFGPTQLPKLTKMFGKSVKSFRDGIADSEEESKDKEDKVSETKAATDEKKD
ncbi:sec-independent protein translocase protein TatA [Oribacterium sp. KHPX15]|uniref:Sec-independent protein translocase subunit TatA/TatB n=1 Tax=unclassified Oribacterium TaxID=2629782 RepID=UPI0004E0FF82|nr:MULTISPECIES: twin-arginine translocase TatA/TatE family subunit [unclassified Oribacterium]SEA40410.1 sec-independent protein translocase protein TatA [Oribacterium sp. KHPX15]